MPGIGRPRATVVHNVAGQNGALDRPERRAMREPVAHPASTSRRATAATRARASPACRTTTARRRASAPALPTVRGGAAGAALTCRLAASRHSHFTTAARSAACGLPAYTGTIRHRDRTSNGVGRATNPSQATSFPRDCRYAPAIGAPQQQEGGSSRPDIFAHLRTLATLPGLVNGRLTPSPGRASLCGLGDLACNGT